LVVITGAARGIGRATAESMLARGARVVLADLDADAVRRACDELRGVGGVYGRRLDVRDPDAFAEMIEDIEENVGAVSVLVNNAGIMMLGALLEQPLSVDRRQVEVNLMGVIHGVRSVLPYMRRRGRGHIVNISSVAGRVGCAHAAVYSATKFAVVGLTEALRQEHLGSGVHFSYVMPAVVNTELTAGTKPPRWPRPLRPERVADAVVNAVVKRRVEVFVPRVSRISVTVPALLPRLAYEALGRWLQVDQLFTELDPDARAAYRARSTR